MQPHASYSGSGLKIARARIFGGANHTRSSSLSKSLIRQVRWKRCKRPASTALTRRREGGHDVRLDVSGYERHGTKIEDTTPAMERGEPLIYSGRLRERASMA